MMTARIVLDTDNHALVCRWCELPVYGPLVLYGVGSPLYLMAYHPLCDLERIEYTESQIEPIEPPTLRPPYLQ
jgi:hypothetical protein